MSYCSKVSCKTNSDLSKSIGLVSSLVLTSSTLSWSSIGMVIVDFGDNDNEVFDDLTKDIVFFFTFCSRER